MAAVSLPLRSAPKRTWWRLAGLKLALWNSWLRDSTSLTGCPSARAAIATSAVCDCSEFFWPKPPPTVGDSTRTLSGSMPSCLARPWRTPSAFWVGSRTVSTPSALHSATVAMISIGFWCWVGNS